MKRLIQWVMAATLICGATVFTACSSSDDNPVIPDLNVADNIIGKWIVADLDGQPALTNEKMVTTFVSTTKAYVSSSKANFSEKDNKWNVYREDEVKIVGNKVTLTGRPNEHTTLINEYNISSITDTELIGKWKHITTIDGVETVNTEFDIRLVKAKADYREEVLGLWECTGLTGGETYNDANGRLEFYADGSYNYWHQNEAGEWESVTGIREFQNYFVDGTMLATRWKNQGEDELREWWEVDNISGDEMVWTALRKYFDGSTFQQKMTWKKVDLSLAENIFGTWMTADMNYEPQLTNQKKVITFVSATKAFMSTSLSGAPGMPTIWNDYTEADVNISGNKLTLTSHPTEQMTVLDEYTILSIDANELNANYKVNIMINGNVVLSLDNVVRYVKVKADYRAAIIGTWEGRCTSEGSVFDDGQEHRWEYKADGTYVYYVKDGDNWVPSENTLNEYFVDGSLLCTRWIDNEQENREWWEISIADGKMNWTALRQKEDGTTFTATFEMKKVE